MKILPYKYQFKISPIRGSFYRIFPGKIVSEDLFDDLLDDLNDREVIKAFEGETNERLMIENERILVNEKIDWATGSCAKMLNAPLAHKRIVPARFAGVGDRAGYYSRKKETAIAEARYHQSMRAISNNDPATSFELVIGKYSHFYGNAVNVIGMREKIPMIYDSENYDESINFGRAVKSTKGVDGIMYDSVRHDNGENLVTFNVLCKLYTQAGFIRFYWDGNKIDRVEEVFPHK